MHIPLKHFIVHAKKRFGVAPQSRTVGKRLCEGLGIRADFGAARKSERVFFVKLACRVTHSARVVWKKQGEGVSFRVGG